MRGATAPAGTASRVRGQQRGKHGESLIQRSDADDSYLVRHLRRVAGFPRRSDEDVGARAFGGADLLLDAADVPDIAVEVDRPRHAHRVSIREVAGAQHVDDREREHETARRAADVVSQYAGIFQFRLRAVCLRP